MFSLYSVNNLVRASSSTLDTLTTDTDRENWKESLRREEENYAATLYKNFAVAFYSHYSKPSILHDIDTTEADREMEKVILDFIHLLSNITK